MRLGYICTNDLLYMCQRPHCFSSIENEVLYLEVVKRHIRWKLEQASQFKAPPYSSDGIEIKDDSGAGLYQLIPPQVSGALCHRGGPLVMEF